MIFRNIFGVNFESGITDVSKLTAKKHNLLHSYWQTTRSDFRLIVSLKSVYWIVTRYETLTNFPTNYATSFVFLWSPIKTSVKVLLKHKTLPPKTIWIKTSTSPNLLRAWCNCIFLILSSSLGNRHVVRSRTEVCSLCVSPVSVMSMRPSRCISLRNMITRHTMPTVCSPSVSHLTLIFPRSSEFSSTALFSSSFRSICKLLSLQFLQSTFLTSSVSFLILYSRSLHSSYSLKQCHLLAAIFLSQSFLSASSPCCYN